MKAVNEVNLKRKEKASLEQQNKALVQYAVEEIWNKGNYTALENVVAQDFVIHSQFPNKDIRGPQGVKDFYTSLRNAFPDIRFTIQNQIAEGDKVVTHWVAEGAHKGSYLGIPPSGKRIKVSAIDIDYIQNGKVAECWTIMDEIGLLIQLGAYNGQEIQKNSELRKSWDGIAVGYDQFVTDTEKWLANETLKRVGLQYGQSFLDIAAGCGGLSLPAARMGAYVLAIDWSAEMIRVLKQRARKEGLTNTKSIVMDGHQLEFPDDLFDVCGSQFGVMLFPDQLKAMKEMVRVTKPGGKVLLIAYGSPHEIEFINFFIAAFKTVVPDFPGLPTNPPPLEFQCADPGILQQRLTEAGLKDVRVEPVIEKIEFSSGQQLWNYIYYGNPIIGHVLSELMITDDKIAIIIRKLEQLVRERAGSNTSAILTDPVNIGWGTKEVTGYV